jgi:hypothetical protein
MKLLKRTVTGFRRVAALSVVLLLACVAVGGALAAGGNSANAKMCQKDGWQTAQTSAGGTFASEDDCVSYGAHGGTVFEPSVTVSPTHVPEETDSTVTVTGFHASSSGTLTFETLGGSGGSISFIGVLTNATGSLPTFFTTFSAGACADGVTGERISYTDGSGVHASAIVSLDCT